MLQFPFRPDAEDETKTKHSFSLNSREMICSSRNCFTTNKVTSEAVTSCQGPHSSILLGPELECPTAPAMQQEETMPPRELLGFYFSLHVSDVEAANHHVEKVLQLELTASHVAPQP